MIKIHISEYSLDGKHWWYTVHAKNGKTLLASETFKRKQSCYKSIYSLLEVVRDGRVEIKDETK